MARTFLKSASSASLEGLLKLLRHGLAAAHESCTFLPSSIIASGALALLGRLRLDRAVGDRVDLLEDARHRRQVGRFDLHQLGDYLLGVASEVDERAAEIERRELHEQGEGVGEREVQIGDLVLFDLARPRRSCR